MGSMCNQVRLTVYASPDSTEKTEEDTPGADEHNLNPRTMTINACQVQLPTQTHALLCKTPTPTIRAFELVPSDEE